MAVHSNAAHEADFATALRDSVLSLESVGNPKIHAATVDQTENAIGELTWRIALRLAGPEGKEWDTAKLRQLRLKIRELASTLADEKGIDLSSPILVETAAFDPPEDETAPPDTPEPNEDTAVTHATETSGSEE